MSISFNEEEINQIKDIINLSYGAGIANKIYFNPTNMDIKKLLIEIDKYLHQLGLKY